MSGRSEREIALREALAAAGDPAKAAILVRFFKTGPGQYGEGDRFRGITVPALRALVQPFRDLPWGALARVLASPFHEDRLAALMILAHRASRGGPDVRERVLVFYLARTPRINNWDLVDLSAPGIVGRRLLEKGDPSLLFKLAESDCLWERRIAIVASHAFIRAGVMDVTTALAEKLLGDRHDLMHKAVGWMLREVGKRNLPALAGFLARHAPRMPRTMLRYSIERLPPGERRRWMDAR